MGQWGKCIYMILINFKFKGKESTFIYLFILIYSECIWGGRREIERDIENILNRPHTQHRVQRGAQSHNPKIMT